jgi:hypothetical protein
MAVRGGLSSTAASAVALHLHKGRASAEGVSDLGKNWSQASLNRLEAAPIRSLQLVQVERDIGSRDKKAARGRLFSHCRDSNYLLAPIAAAAAADAAASAEEVLSMAAEAASTTAEAASTGAGAATGAGATTGATTSSFLPQAVKAAAAITMANRADLFI